MSDHLLLKRRLQILDLAAHSPKGFETITEKVLAAEGYKVITRAGRGADGGVDLTLRAPDGRTVLVQCKNWLTFTVDVRKLRELDGIVHRRHAQAGFLVTSGTFSKSARDYARTTQNERPLTLIDGQAFLKRWKRAQRLERGRRQRTIDRVLKVLYWIDAHLPFGRAVEWTETQLQHRPAWLPFAIGAIGGLVLYAATHLAWPAVELTAIIWLAGASTHGWRLWQRRLLAGINDLADIRSDRMTRGRLLHLVHEALLLQGLPVRLVAPSEMNSYALEAKLGKDRVLVNVLHPRDGNRVTPSHIEEADQLRSKYGAGQATVVSTGVITEDAKRAMRERNVDVIAGAELISFLTAVAPKKKRAGPSLPKVHGPAPS